jgi:hypothetical protein
MRFLLGVVVGIGLTIGGAYLYDGAATDATTTATARPMVNWDVMDAKLERATSRLRREWDRLAAK